MSERLRLRKLGLHKPQLEPRGVPAEGGEDREFDDPADLAVDYTHPIAELNPPVGPTDLEEICDAFSAALIWAGQAQSLVEMGWRLAAMLHVMRPALLEGMALEIRRDDACELRAAMGNRELIKKVGEQYRHVLAWCRRCRSLAQLGQRGFAMIYLINRSAIGGLTNAVIGGKDNKTRQAINKTIQDARDSLAGFRNEVMRGEETRRKCRIAQTSRA